MGTTKSKVNLSEEKGKLKQKFASLIDDDLLFEEGLKEVISAKKQKKLHRTKHELKKIISSLEPDTERPGRIFFGSE